MGVKASDINAKAVVGQISPRPILIMHGGRDDTVPPDNGQKLYDAAGQPKDLWFDPQLGHTQFDFKRPAEYERRIAEEAIEKIRGELGLSGGAAEQRSGT